MANGELSWLGGGCLTWRDWMSEFVDTNATHHYEPLKESPLSLDDYLLCHWYLSQHRTTPSGRSGNWKSFRFSSPVTGLRGCLGAQSAATGRHLPQTAWSKGSTRPKNVTQLLNHYEKLPQLSAATPPRGAGAAVKGNKREGKVTICSNWGMKRNSGKMRLKWQSYRRL